MVTEMFNQTSEHNLSHISLSLGCHCHYFGSQQQSAQPVKPYYKVGYCRLSAFHQMLHAKIPGSLFEPLLSLLLQRDRIFHFIKVVKKKKKTFPKGAIGL